MAKRYFPEPGSDEFDRFLGLRSSVAISRLTVVEFHCLLNRRVRDREIDTRVQNLAAAAFVEDIARGFLEVHALEDQHALAARDFLIRLTALPLRTLDALHLAIATAIGAETIALADHALAQAARALRLKVEWFGRIRSGKRR